MKQPKTHRTPKGQLVLWVVLITLAVVVIGLLGIESAKDMNDWNHWLKSHATALLIWRLALYGATAYGWYRMRQRLTSAGLSTEQHQQLLYAEIAAVAAIALLELHTIRPN
jgi:purine-cytosine permease-like protein